MVHLPSCSGCYCHPGRPSPGGFLRGGREHALPMSQRRSSRLSRLRLCGSDGTATSPVFSAAAGSILPYVSTLDARSLRATCREAHAAVRAFPFENSGYWSEEDRVWYPGPLIGQGLAHSEEQLVACLRRWRACFPCAIGASLAGHPFVTAAMISSHLSAVRSIDLSDCANLTNQALAALTSLERLILNTPSARLTDSGFAPLAGRLRFLVCGNFPALTSAAFVHFQGIETLVMWGNEQEALGDAAFAHLGSVRTLVMGNCDQLTITDAAFAPLRSLQRLLMWGCNQPTITDAAFASLAGLAALDVSGCVQLTGAAFAPLVGLRELIAEGCVQLTDCLWENIRGVEVLGALRFVFFGGRAHGSWEAYPSSPLLRTRCKRLHAAAWGGFGAAHAAQSFHP